MKVLMKVEVENKKVFSTRHATVVMVNGRITVMKVCRPRREERGVTVPERDITFESYTEFENFVNECSEVARAVNEEIIQ